MGGNLWGSSNISAVKIHFPLMTKGILRSNAAYLAAAARMIVLTSHRRIGE
ncbi:Hypothetical protein FKW44_013091 [Caligus rogercresseyi]|uniref:Uncharacterized protein n=1 Tax=Caligus rogercresseyi TaxID=217165 RepID=A0A7T8HKM3_CALRO|nr:Hypothetical protein FKW44_013091 [Caligus rogercresseyi]